MQEVGMFLVTSTSAPGKHNDFYRQSVFYQWMGATPLMGVFRMETSGRTKNKE